VYSTPVLSTTVGFGMKSGVKVVLCSSCPVLCVYWWWGQSVVLAKFRERIFGHYQQRKQISLVESCVDFDIAHIPLGFVWRW